MKTLSLNLNHFLLLLFKLTLTLVECERVKPEIEAKWQLVSASGWYLEGQSSHVGVSFQNEAVDLVLSSSVSALILICSAHYPVYWTHHFTNGQWKSVPTTHLHRTSENFDDPQTYRFYSYLTMTGNSGLGTGTFTCRSAGQDGLHTSRFIFWEGATSTLVFGEGRRPPSLAYYIPYMCTTPSCQGLPSKTVRVDKANHTVTLPCSTNSPQAKISLWKKMGGEIADGSLDYREIDWANTSSGITFDPKVGFTLRVGETENGSSVYGVGVYKCMPADSLSTLDETGSEGTESESRELLILNVTTGTQVDMKKSGESELLSGKAKYSFDTSTHARFGDRIVCCSNGTKPPRIYKASCSTKYACTTLRKQLQDFQYFDESDIRRGNCRSSVVGPLYRSLYAPVIGVFRCFGDGIDVTREYYIPPGKTQGTENSNDSAIYYDGEIRDLNQSTLISFSCDRNGVVVADQLLGYTNHSVTLVCHASNYLFVLGVRWSVMWRNGTTQLLPERGGYVIEESIGAELRNELEFRPTQDIHAVICHAPLYDSSHWVNRTLRLNVSESEGPGIKGASVERVVWVLGDSGKELRCEGTGVPAPTYSWTEPMTYDSYFDQNTYTYKVSANWSEYSGNRNKVYGERSVTLRFKQVLPTMAGHYVCTASSLDGLGTATKTFVVTVSDKAEEVGGFTAGTPPPLFTTPKPHTQTPFTSPSGGASWGVKSRTTSSPDTPPHHVFSGSGSDTSHGHSNANRNGKRSGGGVGVGTVTLICMCAVGVIGLLIGGGLMWKKGEWRGRGDEDEDGRDESESDVGVSYQDLRSFNAVT